MAAKKKAAKKTSTPKLDSIDQAAAALPREAVQRLSYDPLEAKRSFVTGFNALQKFKATLRRLYPGINLDELAEAPAIFDRLLLAQQDVHTAGAAKNVVALAKQTFGYRRDLLSYAQSLARRGLVAAKALAKIEQGTGQTDSIDDVLRLVKLLAPHQARVEAAFEPGFLTTAEKAAQDTLAAQGDGRDDLSELTERRDRLATLALRRFDRLRVGMAAVTSFNEASTLVPSLSAGTRTTVKPATPAKPA